MSDSRTSSSAYPVLLPADPTTDKQAATKHYTDQRIATRVSKAGDVMTGPLVLPGAPVADNEAATKKYVDDSIATVTSLPAESVIFTPDGNVSSVNVQEAIVELDDEKVAKAGDTMTGPLILDADVPLSDRTAAPKIYVDKMGTETVAIAAGDWAWSTEFEMYYIDVSHTRDRRTAVTAYDTDGVEVFLDVIYSSLGVNQFELRIKTAIDLTVILT